MAKRGLGKGLDALFLDNNTDNGSVVRLKVSEIEPNKNQPRTDFDESALHELSDSIKEHGILQPLVVRTLDRGGYQIVAGERRWRASRLAGLTEVPVIIRELDDNQTLQIAMIENLQREDLNVVELARGYKALMEDYQMTQEQVAEKLGKSRPVVANTIRLLALPDRVLEELRRGSITTGHAKALLSLEDEALIEEMAEKAVRGQILVRDIEKLAKERKRQAGQQAPSPKKETATETAWGESYHKEMELALSAELGRRVTITTHGKKSVLQLEFYSDNELADIAARLTKSS